MRADSFRVRWLLQIYTGIYAGPRRPGGHARAQGGGGEITSQWAWAWPSEPPASS
ncbi:hypothetical protein QJS66_21610 [Kocuria rhizophila]|nr:hypothetical protein QJS66_21610 [Kocuria rhizophila]